MNLENQKILILDDDPIVCEVTSSLLNMQGFAHTVCYNGKEALERIQEESYPLILLDYSMPDMDGIEFLGKAREQGYEGEVVVVTGNSSYEMAVQFHDLNVYDFLNKPFQAEQLTHVVRKALEKRSLVIKQRQSQLLLRQQHLELQETLAQYESNISYQNRLLDLIDVFQELGKFSVLSELQPFIIATVTRMMTADRSTLFLVDHKTNELYSQVAEGMGTKEIRFPVGVGIAGSVAKESETVLIPDAYEDSRFNPAFDKQTGYRTRNILCMPMINLEGKVIGVIQVLNKLSGDFLDEDITILSAFNSLAAMSLESVLLLEEQERLNQDLQKAMKSQQLLLENIQDGFLILDRKGVIQGGYSKVCESYLGVSEELTGKPFQEIKLEGRDGKTRQFLKDIGSWLELGFTQTDLDLWDEFSKDKLVVQRKKYLNLSFRRIMIEGEVHGIVLSIQDVTESRKLEQEVEQRKVQSEDLMEMVSAITKLGQMPFLSEFQLVNEMLEELTGMLGEHTIIYDQKVHEIFRKLHSMKGLLQNLGMDNMSRSVHQEEDCWMEMRSISGPITLERTRREWLDGFLERINFLFNTFFRLYPSTQESMLKEPDEKESVAYKLEYSHDNLSYLAVSQILKAEAMVHAQNAKKDIVWSTLERDLKLEPDVWKPMRPVLSHLIRNSIDHGLEQNMDRVQKGKEAQGSVFFDYSQTLHSGQAWHEFIIRDDGRGMEADKIFLRAVRLGLVAEEQEEEFSTSEKLRLILLPGFTTREEVSETSGRGVGMDVVKAVVEDELQGEIRIDSKVGKGTEFKLFVPLSIGS